MYDISYTYIQTLVCPTYMHICICKYEDVFCRLAVVRNAYFGLLVIHAWTACHMLPEMSENRKTISYRFGAFRHSFPSEGREGSLPLKMQFDVQKQFWQLVNVRKMPFSFKEELLLFSFVLCIVFWNISRKHWWNHPTRDGCLVVLTMVGSCLH